MSDVDTPFIRFVSLNFPMDFTYTKRIESREGKKKTLRLIIKFKLKLTYSYTSLPAPVASA